MWVGGRQGAVRVVGSSKQQRMAMGWKDAKVGAEESGPMCLNDYGCGKGPQSWCSRVFSQLVVG